MLTNTKSSETLFVIISLELSVIHNVRKIGQKNKVEMKIFGSVVVKSSVEVDTVYNTFRTYGSLVHL